MENMMKLTISKRRTNTSKKQFYTVPYLILEAGTSGQSGPHAQPY